MEIRRNIARGAAVLGLAAMLALPVIAQARDTSTNGSKNMPSTNTSVEKEKMMKPKAMKPSVDLGCMRSAVTKRDDAIIAAWDGLSSSGKSALTTRKAALGAAWDMTDAKARRKALSDAWKAFSASIKDARKTFRVAKDAAWSAFKAGRKTCSGTGEDSSHSGLDASL